TAEHLKFLRDVDLPARLAWIHRSEVKWKVFSGIDAEHARLARENYFGYGNSRKVYTGLLAGLQDRRLIDAKAAADKALLTATATDPARAKTADAWEQIALAQVAHESIFHEKYLYDRVLTAGLLGHAMTIVRLAAESARPDGQRLPEYRDSQRDSLLLRLYSPE